MALQDKYRKLIDFAGKPRVENLSVSEQNNVLYVSGSATEDVKEQLWKMYNEIDPDMRAGDMVLNINTIGGTTSGNGEMYEIKSGDSLSKIASKYPGLTWNKIYEANKDIISDINVIKPGQKIKIPV